MAVKKAFFLFNLKPGKTAEDYIAWTKVVNHPEAARINSIQEFHDYVSVSSLGGKPVAWQFVEEVTITDHEQYAKDLADPGRSASSAAWREWVEEYIVVLTDIIK